MHFPWDWILAGNILVTCLDSFVSFVFVSALLPRSRHLSHWQAMAWLTTWEFRERPEGLQTLTQKACFLRPEYILYLYLSQPDSKLEKKTSDKLLVPKRSQCRKSSYYTLSWGKNSISETAISTGFERTSQKMEEKKAKW